MKKFILLFLCLSFTFILTSCNKSTKNPPPINNDSLTTPEINDDILPPSENHPPAIDEFIPPNKEETNDSPSINKTKSYVVSSVNGLKIRSKPNLSSTVLGYINKNDAVANLGEDNGFFITVFKETTGYVYADFCKTIEIPTVNDATEKAISLGEKLLGYPYVWGSQRYHWGNGKLNPNFKNGEFDCSAFVQYIYYKSNGVLLEVNTRKQVYNGIAVNQGDLRRGDLMFFTNESRKKHVGTERIGHVGIYLGENYILHTASDYAVIEPISDTRWGFYITSRRVI